MFFLVRSPSSGILARMECLAGRRQQPFAASCLLALGLALLSGCSSSSPATADGGSTSDATADDGAGGGSDATSMDGGTGMDATGDSGPTSHVQIMQNVQISGVPTNANFERASASLPPLAGGPFANVNLVVDLTSPCFPWSNWDASAPPPGQAWPVACDPFDRIFLISVAGAAAGGGDAGALDAGASDAAVVDAAATDAGSTDAGAMSPPPPALELVHAVTPFGGPEHIETDVTDLFNSGSLGPQTFNVFISTGADSTGHVTGSSDGWFVSARLDVTPGMPPKNVLGVIPLFDARVNAGQTISDIPFTLPPGTTSALLEYKVTGHGGVSDTSSACIGPADEFCQRLHHVYIDDQQIQQTTPWRTDCASECTITDGGPFGQYCAQNPCGDPQSVQAPRANWCPGTPSVPYEWPLPASGATPGAHTFKFAIDNVVGYWEVSAVVYAYGN